VGLRINFAIEDNLNDSLPIPYLDKDEAPQVPSALDPSQEGHLAIHISSAQLPTIIGPFKISQQISQGISPLCLISHFNYLS
jgi:hypothetical protein